MEKFILALLQTNAVIYLIVGAFATYLVKWLASHDTQQWEKYEGWAIAAIKAAEKAIPDDGTQPGLLKLDFALRAFLSKYEKAAGRPVGESEQQQIEAWISEIHAELEAADILSQKKEVTDE